MKCVLPFLLLFLIIGCSDDHKAVSKRSNANEIVISVDGRTLTRKQVQDRAEMMLKFRMLQNPAMKVNEMGKARKKLAATYPGFFVEHAIWANFAATNKVAVDKEILNRIRRRAMAGILKGKNAKYGALRAKFGALAEVFDEHVRMMALTASAKKYLCDSNPTNFPPDYASNVVRRIAEYNARMVLTNALIYAQATNCWQELKAGADFGDMVKKYSTIELERNNNGEWGTLGRQQLEPDEKLHAFAMANEAGAFSPPIEGDNGLMILRIDNRKGDDFALSRIFFQLPLFNAVLTEEQVLKKARAKYNSKLIAKTFRKLRRQAKIIRNPGKKKGPKGGKVVRAETNRVENASNSRSL